MITAMAGGSFFALLTGGNLAVYYATRLAGEALGMKSYKVMYLQFATLSVFNIGVSVAFVASGIFVPIWAVGLSIFSVGTFAAGSFTAAKMEKESSPYRTLRNALPQSFLDLPFFATDPALDQR